MALLPVCALKMRGRREDTDQQRTVNANNKKPHATDQGPDRTKTPPPQTHRQDTSAAMCRQYSTRYACGHILAERLDACYDQRRAASHAYLCGGVPPHGAPCTAGYLDHDVRDAPGPCDACRRERERRNRAVADRFARDWLRDKRDRRDRDREDEDPARGRGGRRSRYDVTRY